MMFNQIWSEVVSRSSIWLKVKAAKRINPGGASEANALRGKYFQYFEDLNLLPNTEIESEGRF